MYSTCISFVYMNTAVINIRTEVSLKNQLQKLAEEMGLSISSLINSFIKQLVRTKRYEISAVMEEPSPYLIRCIKEAEEDYKKGNYYSFAEPQKALEFLDKMIKRK